MVMMLGGGMSEPVKAQEETEMPTEPEEKTPLQIAAEEAELRAKIAESQLKEAESKKNLEELGLVDSDFEPEKAGVTAKDKAGYYGTLLSFSTLESAAEAFVTAMKNAKVPTTTEKNGVETKRSVVVTSDYEFSKGGTLWHLAEGKFSDFKEDFVVPFPALPNRNQQEFLSAAIPVITASLGAVSELASFFRVKRELSGREVAPSTESLVALVTKKLKAAGYKPVLPQLVVKYDTALAQRIDGVRALEKAAEDRKAQRKRDLAQKHNIDIDKVSEEIADLKKKLKDDPNNTQLQARLRLVEDYQTWWNKNSGQLSTVKGAFRSFMVRLETVPEKATQAPIELLYAYEALVNDNALILLAQAVSQGADVETSSGTLRKTKISYVGGSASLFYLSDVRGDILLADVIPMVASKSFTGRIETQPTQRVH